MPVRLLAPILTVLFVPGLGFGETTPSPPREPVREIAGSLVIGGGGTLPAVVYDAFFKLAGGARARLVVIPTASAPDKLKDADKLLEPWKKRGPAAVELLHAPSMDKVNDPALTKLLAGATGVWFEGGDQARLLSAYRGSTVEAELPNVLKRGGVIGGTSGGAAAMSQLMITGGTTPAKLATGFGFLPGGVIEQHLLKRDRLDRLIDTVSRNPGWFGLGVDEGTAVIIQGRALAVVGQSYAVTCLAAGKDRPVRCQVLKSGDKADLVALSRAALARTHDPHPSSKPATPFVAKGSLIIGGGGILADAVWKKFIDLAGGPDASLVVIRTAQDDPFKGEPSETIKLRKMGAKHIKTLHAKSRTKAESPEFLAVLHGAKGIWFTGGRQWRLVDAYQDTAAETAFHELLARGGVIGGSSAGASIQADYMVRGDPLGNLNISAEGYERGLGFLKGVALDQHFLKRERRADMTELMARYPQLLGIGIDEGAAVHVHGEVMDMLGTTNVLVYDRARPVTGPHDYEVLTPGTRFNLRTRQKIEKN